MNVTCTQEFTRITEVYIGDRVVVTANNGKVLATGWVMATDLPHYLVALEGSNYQVCCHSTEIRVIGH